MTPCYPTWCATRAAGSARRTPYLRHACVNVAEYKKAHLPFAGAAIVITRPVGEGSVVARSVRAGGGTPVLLPGLALRAIDADIARSALGGLARSHAVIFTSPAAVRFAFVLRPSLRIARGSLFALGAGTARALAKHGLDAAIPERSDSEGLLAMRELAKVRGRRIALIGAPGGRDLIAPMLRRRGATVEAIHVYRRVAPRLTSRHFDALDAARDPLITLVSSGEALAHLVALLPAPQIERLRGQIIVVSSARLAGVAREHAFGEIVLARSAAPGDLLAAAEAALGRHRL
jgi:uroporphyrinogen-III synthase